MFKVERKEAVVARQRMWVLHSVTVTLIKAFLSVQPSRSYAHRTFLTSGYYIKNICLLIFSCAALKM